MKHLQIITSIFAGLLFGLGLALSGMLDPAIVTAFLTPLNNWDYSLILVMGSAIGVTAPSYYFIFKNKAPLFDTEFHISQIKQIDKPLITGAALFGIGWGIYGLCPGPAIAQLFSFQFEPILFILTMALSMFITDKFSDKNPSAHTGVQSDE